MPDLRDHAGPDCDAVRQLLHAHARGDLAQDQEDTLLRHAAGCPACRAALAEGDPAALFQELRGGPLPDGFWRGFDRALRARLEEERRPGWRRHVAREALGSALRPPRLAYVTAPLAMVFLLGVTLYVTMPGLFVPAQRMRRPEQGLRSPYVTPAAPRMGEAGPRAGRQMAEPRPAAKGPAVVEPPPLEEVSSPAARVYRLDVGGQDPTPIYMVVDETIEF